MENKYDLHSYDFHFLRAYTFGTFFLPKYGQKHCKPVICKRKQQFTEPRM